MAAAAASALAGEDKLIKEISSLYRGRRFRLGILEVDHGRYSDRIMRNHQPIETFMDDDVPQGLRLG